MPPIHTPCGCRFLRRPSVYELNTPPDWCSWHGANGCLHGGKVTQPGSWRSASSCVTLPLALELIRMRSCCATKVAYRMWRDGNIHARTGRSPGPSWYRVQSVRYRAFRNACQNSPRTYGPLQGHGCVKAYQERDRLSLRWSRAHRRSLPIETTLKRTSSEWRQRHYTQCHIKRILDCITWWC